MRWRLVLLGVAVGFLFHACQPMVAPEPRAVGPGVAEARTCMEPFAPSGPGFTTVISVDCVTTVPVGGDPINSVGSFEFFYRYDTARLDPPTSLVLLPPFSPETHTLRWDEQEGTVIIIADSGGFLVDQPDPYRIAYFRADHPVRRPGPAWFVLGDCRTTYSAPRPHTSVLFEDNVHVSGLRGGDYQFCVEPSLPEVVGPTEVVEVRVAGTFTGAGDPTWTHLRDWVLMYTYDLYTFSPPENLRFLPPSSDESHWLDVEVWENWETGEGVVWVGGWRHDSSVVIPIPEGERAYVPLFRAEHRALRYGDGWFALESEDCHVTYRVRRWLTREEGRIED